MDALTPSSPARHTLILAVALAIILLVNAAAGVVAARAHESEAFVTRPVPAGRQPQMLVVGGSYGRRGIQTSTLDAALFDGQPLSAAWFCDGTSPASWRAMLADSNNLASDTRTVVLQLAPYVLRRPAVFKELALRRVFGVSDVPRLLAMGQIDDANEVLVSRMPLYRSRRGLRQKLLAPVLMRLGADENNALKRQPVTRWPQWHSDATEMAELAGIAQDCAARGVTLVVAEWPMSAHLDASVAAAVATGFRPELRAHAAAHGYVFLELPATGRYVFDDEVHPRPEDGRRWCEWLASRQRGLRA